jgi:hypothetical protein
MAGRPRSPRAPVPRHQPSVRSTSCGARAGRT